CLGAGRKVVERPAAEAFATLAARGAPVEDVLLAALASPLPRRRWGAAFALSLVGNPPAATLPVLLETLGADDGDLRWAAAPIVRALETGDERVRRAAAAGLGALGERSAPVLAALHAASASADRSLRRAAEGALRQLGGE